MALAVFDLALLLEAVAARVVARLVARLDDAFVAVEDLVFLDAAFDLVVVALVGLDVVAVAFFATPRVFLAAGFVTLDLRADVAVSLVAAEAEAEALPSPLEAAGFVIFLGAILRRLVSRKDSDRNGG